MISVSMFANEPSKVALPANDYLLREGDNPDFLYILLSGRARILVGAREVGVMGPGQIVGEMSLIENSPHSSSIQAQTDCEFARIDEKRFRFLTIVMPGFALAVMRTMGKRLRGADREIESCNQAWDQSFDASRPTQAITQSA
jgi:CRP/FNR family cyclic AMP-dependent transcriptional regulator